ncbi:MAG: prolyl oligopeptidase family serine peptidase [Gemmatimonadaceae bacterium]|nr:prolyl oligopeptidase family serine peptidase [Gemmatimonadaceae bacterium]
MREEFEVASAGGRVVRGDLYRAAQATNGVIICHGFKGFARWGAWPLLAAAFNERGLNAIAFDFSGSGVGVDRESFTELDAFAANTYRCELEDLNAVASHATTQGWTSRDCGLFGHSRGGATTIFFAADSDRVCCLVTWASIATIERWSDEQVRDWKERGYIEVVNTRTNQVMRIEASALEECVRESRYGLDVERAAERVRANWLIIHGAEDDVVPVDDAHRLARANSLGDHGMRAELRIVEGANHVFGATHPLTVAPAQLASLIDETADFFARELG